MPGGMDGIETTRRVLAARPSVRVIALTASMDEARMLGVLRAGAEGYVRRTRRPNAARGSPRRGEREDVYRSRDRPAAARRARRGRVADLARDRRPASARVRPIEQGDRRGARGERRDRQDARRPLVLILIYLGISFYFMDRFNFGSKINGIDSTGKTVKEIEQTIEDDIENYILTILEKDEARENIEGSNLVWPMFRG